MAVPVCAKVATPRTTGALSPVMRSVRLEPPPAGTDLPVWEPSPWRNPRLHVGVFSPLVLPQNWEGSVWDRP